QGEPLERRTSFELPVELVGDVTQLDHLRHRMTVATRPSHVNVWQRWRVNIGALAVPGIPRVLTPPGLQDREGGLAAQHILLGRSPAGDADGADDGDAVENHETAGDGEQAPAMRDEEAPEPGLAGLRLEIRGGDVKGGRR